MQDYSDPKVRTAQWQVSGLTQAMRTELNPERYAELRSKRDTYAALLTPEQLADCSGPLKAVA